MQPGDIILIHTPFDIRNPATYFGALIRFGAWLRKDTRPYRHWNHVAVVLDVAGGLADAQARGVVETSVGGYSADNYVVVNPFALLGFESLEEAVAGDQMVNFANRQIGVRYGFLSIFWFALTILFQSLPIVVDARKRSWFCSELAAAALLRADIEIADLPPQLVSPAHIAKHFGVTR
jgi:hypothetical protein